MEPSTEQTILEAAKKLFMEKGFSMTSTADIAREAGCNTAMIHYYYRTKDNLFQAVFTKEIDKFSQGLFLIPSQDISLEEKITLMTEAFFDFLRSNPRLPFLLLNELNINPARIADIKFAAIQRVEDVRAILQQEIDREQARGRVGDITALELISNIVSMNVMVFLLLPVAMELGFVDVEHFMDCRKQEIIKIVINSLKV